MQGDQVDEFQPLCEVQSDKATIEITSRFKGKVHQIHFGPGDIVKVVIRSIFVKVTSRNYVNKLDGMLYNF